MSYDGLELTPNERECVYELEKAFDSVLIYKGDAELISSVNAEYSLDQDDIFRTDGDITICAHVINNMYFTYKTCIRNATYLIIADRPEGVGTWRFHLRMDHPYLESHFQKVMEQLTSMKKGIRDMK